MNTQPAEVGNFGEALGKAGEQVVNQRQRIAAAENDFVDRTIGRDFVDRRPPLVERVGALVIREMPAETVAAMDGAGPSLLPSRRGRGTFAVGPAGAWRRSRPRDRPQSPAS